jgi:hypothetical protein
MIDTATALISLRPNADWGVSDDVIEWLDTEQTRPTDAEITAEVTRLQAEFDSNQYQRDRATDYPAIADQLDDIFHNGIDGWKATIQLTKDKYPKEIN